MTRNFMLPLEKYIETLVPKTLTIHGNVPKLRPFREATFIAYLIKMGKASKELELYRAFIRTPNFVWWFRAKKKVEYHNLYHRYYNMLQKRDVIKAFTSEVESVDMYLRLKSLVEAKPLMLPDDLVPKIRDMMVKLVASLPDDLKVSVLQNLEAKDSTSEEGESVK
mmetsp:Transcript_19851/g.22092  ORF Transcript_19851/g.22092 Transcript_19851/m.22092 type:complete len:166 (+) Transcript_19851:1120-1617(+)